MLIKLGQAVTITSADIKSSEAVLSDPEILERFQKMATDLKMIAPKAKDFLYFTAVMMHAAEAALLNPDGSIKKDAKGNEITAHWEKKGNSLRWVCSDPSIRPYRNNNCFPAGTLIQLGDGTVKNIEDIQIGDEVITHKGQVRKVTETFITDYEGELIAFKVQNNSKIYCTPEHPFYNVDFSDFNTTSRYRRALSERIKNSPDYQVKYKFSKAGDLKPGDIVTSPALDAVFASPDLNPDRGYLLGIYAAEGSFSRKYGKRQGVHWTLNIKETAIADKIKECFAREFPECSVTIMPEPERSTLKVSATGYNIPEYFFKHVGEYSHEKKLSASLFYAEPEVKKSFLAGWLDGDGCKDEFNKLIGITTSANLAYQIRGMFNSLRIPNTLKKISTKNKKITILKQYGEYDCRDHFRSEISGDSYKLLEIEKNTAKYTFDPLVGHRNRNMTFDKQWGLHCVREVEKVPFKGKVYNFEVEEDHSYVANGLIVHNCDIFSEQELLKAHKKWIGRPLCLDHKSSSVDMVRGIIVDTYYDYPNKRIIALCALDKVNYPDLARKVSTGYATSVSMGTRVGQAICYDCGQVARVEADFCNHMRHKSAYGEINVDLDPMELSIVVNGADPKAKIRQVIAHDQRLEAAKEALAQYENMLAEKKASLTAESSDETKDIELCNKIEGELEKATKVLEDLKTMVSELKGSEEAEQDQYNEEKETEEAEDANSVKEAADSAVTIRLAALEQSLNKLSENFNNFIQQGIQMTQEKKAYILGTEEPGTPGKPKYEKENSDAIRDGDDKHMSGQMDTGPVDGMHPGYDSFGESEEARKKRLLRASEENDRALKRQAALAKAKEAIAAKKEAYLNGAGGVNDPKHKYPKEDAEKIRDKEDKQMQGAPPFPGVGKVDEPYGNDKKVKEMLSRAKLTAKFLKAANPDGSDNLGDSRWQVYADDKIILTATVSDLTGGRVDALYDSVATKDFGRNMLNKIRVEGFDKASKLFKGAQDAAPAPAPMAMPELPAAPEAPVASPVDEGGTGDQKENVKDTLDRLENDVADLRQGVEAVLGESGNELEGSDAMPEVVAAILPYQKRIAKSLVAGLKAAIAQLEDHVTELKIAKHVLDNTVDTKDLAKTNALAKDACEHASRTMKEANQVRLAVVKYESGLRKMKKLAAQNVKIAQDPTVPVVGKVYQAGDPFMPLDAVPGVPYQPKADAGPATTPVTPATPAKTPAPAPAGAAKKDAPEWRDLLQGSGQVRDLKPEELAKADDGEKEDENDAMVKKPDGTEIKLEGDEVVKALASDDLSTKEGRAKMRAKLAEKGCTFSDMPGKAHGTTGPSVSVDVKTPEAKVETLEEVNKAVMDVATAPVKLRKDAEKLNDMITKGMITATDKEFDKLVTAGLDPAVVKYWKQYYGQAKDGGSQFAAELTKTHVAEKSAEEKQAESVKLIRAYGLAYEMSKKGYCSSNPEVIQEKVAEILEYTDAGFESMQRMVRKSDGLKTASVLPNVGHVGIMGEDITKEASVKVPAKDLTNAFEAMWSQKKGSR